MSNDNNLINNFPTTVSDKRASKEAVAKIRLTANNVLVRIHSAPEISKGGIVFAPSARQSLTERLKRCEVLSVGPGSPLNEACQGCKGAGVLEYDIGEAQSPYRAATVEEPNPETRREACSVCGGRGHGLRKPYVQPGDVCFFNYLSDHGEITIEEERGLKIVRDVVFQAVVENYQTDSEMDSETSKTTRSRIRPLGDRILVRRSKELETSKGGIIIPDNAKEKQVQGEVLAVGPGNYNSKTDSLTAVGIKPGEVVVFGKYEGNEIQFGGEALVILKEENAMAVLE